MSNKTLTVWEYRQNMLLQRKAVYNLIQLNVHKIFTGELRISDLEHWQLEDYRAYPTETLFHCLKTLDVKLDYGDFEKYANSFEDPEEMTDALTEGRSALEQDRIFLIVFELWRRILPEKRSLSIFCDELDYQMMCHDLEKPSQIQDSLIYLQKLLDEHVDQGLDPQKAFQSIQQYCANDIESFLFDYILQQIDLGNLSIASELLEGFSRYPRDTIWFDYLNARTATLEDPELGYIQLEKIITKITKKTRLDLVEEILFFLAASGSHTLFTKLAKKAVLFLEREEDFQEILEASYVHYDHLKLREQAFAIAEMFHQRAHIKPETPLSKEDSDLDKLRHILNQKLPI